MTSPRLLLVSPRPPRRDGQGDQRRAHMALTSLGEEWTVEVVSWLPDAGAPLGVLWLKHPTCFMRALALSAVMPLHVAYVQSFAPRSLVRRARSGLPAVFMTDRAVPWRTRCPYAIDFIDDLGGAAFRRAGSSGVILSRFWRWEARRLRRFDVGLAAHAVVALAVSEDDAAAISPDVIPIRHSIGTHLRPAAGTKVVFTGNLFYPPNLDAARWICESLVPRLKVLGIDPGRVVIAGRRPPRSLQEAAAVAGVDLRADVPDLLDVLSEAAVVVAPVVFGAGVQSKVLDAVGAGRPCVLTPFANKSIGLQDAHSGIERERTPEAFAGAIVQLLDDPASRERLADNAREFLQLYAHDAVAIAWRDSLRTLASRACPDDVIRPDSELPARP